MRVAWLQDTDEKWVKSSVRSVKEDKVFVHYAGWSAVNTTTPTPLATCRLSFLPLACAGPTDTTPAVSFCTDQWMDGWMIAQAWDEWLPLNSKRIDAYKSRSLEADTGPKGAAHWENMSDADKSAKVSERALACSACLRVFRTCSLQLQSSPVLASCLGFAGADRGGFGLRRS